MIIEKTCTRCGISKPADLVHFPKKNKTSNQLNSWCRECYRIRSSAWSAQNPTQKAATDKAYRESEGTQYKERRKARYARLSISEKQRRKEFARRHNDKLKREAMEHYGGAFCQCCGETELSMLALDHIGNDGASHRKSLTGKSRKMPIQSFIWAKKNGWPPIYQVSCFNCNWARHWNNGICPHETRRQELTTLASLPTEAGVLRPTLAA